MAKLKGQTMIQALVRNRFKHEEQNATSNRSSVLVKPNLVGTLCRTTSVVSAGSRQRGQIFGKLIGWPFRISAVVSLKWPISVVRVQMAPPAVPSQR